MEGFLLILTSLLFALAGHALWENIPVVSASWGIGVIFEMVAIVMMYGGVETVLNSLKQRPGRHSSNKSLRDRMLD